MRVIDVDELVVRYGSLAAVDHVSFSVAAGEVLALLGPNGAGKTTTVETLEGYRRPSAGRVAGARTRSDRGSRGARASGGRHVAIRRRVSGHPSTSRRCGCLRRTTTIPRIPTRFSNGSASATGARRRGGGCRVASSSASHSHSPSSASPRWCSSTSRRRGSTSLDGSLIRELIRELRHSGVTVLVTTHDLEEAERIADRIVIIDRGEVVASGTPAELMRSSNARRDPIRRAATPRHREPRPGAERVRGRDRVPVSTRSRCRRPRRTSPR